jgi:tetratricopeptide (TPR) repeat protein
MGSVPSGCRLWMGLFAGVLAAVAAGQERTPRPTPCPEDSARGAPEATVRNTLLEADLASASHDEERAADLLADVAERAPGELTPADWLTLVRRDESSGSFASAAARYARYLRGLEGSEEDTRWVGPRLRQLNIAAQANPPAPAKHIPPAEARLVLADGRAAVARVDSKAAREKFNIALRLDARYAEAAVALGALDAREGRAADAVREYRLALAADPERVDAMVPLSNLLWKSPDRVAKAESLILIDRAVARRPDLPTLQRRSAERWAEWGDAKAALERLDAWRAGASPSERARTDRLRGELAARLPRGAESAEAAPPESPGSSPKAAARRAAPASLPADRTGVWIWGAGAAVLITLGAAVRVYRRRSFGAQAISPSATTTLVAVEELRRILESIASERHLPAPELAAKGFPEEGKPAWTVRISPRDWERIWRAVFANALSALRAVHGVAPRLTLFGSLVRDSKIPGLAVRLALADNAPGVVTTETIHGPGASREWSLVDELIRANGGSIAVAPSIDRQYTKRLVIELTVIER